jgi:phage protein D
MSGTITIPAPDARAPRIAMRINGQDAPGLIEFSVCNNSYRAADTFSAHLSMTGWGAAGAAFVGLPPACGPAFWAETDAIDFELLAWLDGRTPPCSIIRGLVDKVEFSFDYTTISVSGRDYSSSFIDAKTSEKFADQTLSQIAATLAARHPLPGSAAMQVSATSTTTKAGDYYKAAQVALTDEVSEWTLLQWLAEQEGLDVWVAGNTLYVQPPPGVEVPPLGILYQPPSNAAPAAANASRISVERVLTLSRDIVVTVRSWNHGQKQAIEVTRRGSKILGPGQKTTQRGLPPHTYVFTIPGLTQVQAEQYAANKLAELSRHERVVTVCDLPAVPDLTVRRLLRLSGTQTAFDQDYFIAEITRRFGWNGCSMEIRAKNSSPRNVV